MIGLLAAEHLLNCGLWNFAVCGPVRRQGYEDSISESFVKRIQDAGFKCTVYHPTRSALDPRSWEILLHDLQRWLLSLPKPVRILTWFSIRGRQVTEACMYANIKVPEEVAVIAGGFDHVMSKLSNPPLSSVDAPAYQVG
ncbi:MAG: substrate-binding domain-containing protein [Pirellulales bacterium]|nr:substrate-binding domain-containing protein [Pirellulales bacterium]